MKRRDFLHDATKSILWSAFAPIALCAQARSEEVKNRNPWPAEELMEPKELADRLAAASFQGSILCVGFPVLYRGAHIPGSRLAGPCSKPDGLALLHDAVSGLARGHEIIAYCGCCPFDQCPNIRPAYAALRQMRFTRLKILHVPTNLHTDWIAKGYPVERARES